MGIYSSHTRIGKGHGVVVSHCGHRDEDLKLLRACVSEWETKSDLADIDEPNWFEPFREMLANLESGRYLALTEKQRAWVRGVHERLFDVPTYENLFSAGKVPRGGYGATPTPEVLKHLPKRPPGR